MSGGWAPALRIARRDATRARGRSLLVVIMVALPVLAVVALDVLVRTFLVSAPESVSRQLGTADAVIASNGQLGPLKQSPTSTDAFQPLQELTGPTLADSRTTDEVRAALPAGSRLVAFQSDQRVRLQTLVRSAQAPGFSTAGVQEVSALVGDPADPLLQGLRPLRAGAYPAATGQVAVTEQLADDLGGVGTSLTTVDGVTLQVVGVVRDPNLRDGVGLLTGPGTLPSPDDSGGSLTRTWLAAVPGGLSWAQVQGLNAQGLLALSADVLRDPPPDPLSGSATDVAVALGVIVSMVLLEVVLLAGPAFAVSARRQRRSLALLAAGGGAPKHLRRVVLSGGLVLGAAAGVAGALLGILLARLALPLFASRLSDRPGPFEVPALDVVAIAAFAVLSGLLAALVPALSAARLDVVAVLAGRRGTTRAPRWPLAFGLLLLTVGVALSISGATGPNAELRIAVGAVPTVLGAALLAPTVLDLLGRLITRVPLPLAPRFALRDAARQRGRTAPAVAAVTAVVAGAVALAVGAGSDDAEAKATYTLSSPLGTGLVGAYGNLGRPLTDSDWSRLDQTVRQQLPTATVTPVLQVKDSVASDSQTVLSGLPGTTSEGGQLLIGPESVDLLGLPPAAAQQARAALTAGQVVTFAQVPGGGPPPAAVGFATARLTRTQLTYGETGDEETELSAASGEVLVLQSPTGYISVGAVLPRSVADRLGFALTTGKLLVSGTELTSTAAERVTQVLAAAAPLGAFTSFQVERGYDDGTINIVLLLLGLTAAVVMLAGTITSVLLALSEAKPDLATLAAVGARPRLRRAVAACYAAVVGLLGAALGIAAGLVPGIAISRPLTDGAQTGRPVLPGLPAHFLVIPWGLLAALLIGVPALAATAVALATRSRLPMIRRLA